MRRFLFFISLLVLLFSANGQGLVVLQNNFVFKKNYHYRNEKAPESIPNYTIDRMSSITAPTLDNFFGFRIFEKTQIIKLPHNEFRILLSADSIKSYNLLDYKGYKLDNLVFPDRVKIFLQLKNENNGKEFLLNTERSFSIKQKILWDTLIYDSTGMAFFSVTKPRLSFSFSQDVKKKLDSALKTIDKLSALQPQLLSIGKKLDKLKGAKAGMVRIYNIDLRNIEKDLEKINPEKITGKEMLFLKDEGSYALYDSLKRECVKLRKRFDQMIKMPEYEYFSEGYKALKKGNNDQAASYFLKSISQKNDYAPPFYYLARMAYRRGDWDSCAVTILHIIKDLKPDFTTRKNTLILGSELYNSITYQAENLIAESRLNEAVKILNIAINLCGKSNTEMICSGKANALLSQAKQELFDSWTSITEKSIDNNKVDLSMDYLKWTRDFYRKNQNYIGDSSSLDTLKIRLIHLLVLNAAAKCNKGSYRKSIKYTRLADSLCAVANYNECRTDLHNIKVRAYSGLYNKLLFQSNFADEKAKSEAETLKEKYPEFIVESPDTLTRQATVARYNTLIENGISFLAGGEYHRAYEAFNQAAEMETSIVQERCDTLSLLIKRAAKPLILSDLKAGNLKAWGMHYKAVNSILRMAREETLKTGLENDMEIKEALAHLENLAYKNKCAQVSVEFTANMKTAAENLRFKAFDEAAKNWDKAVLLAKQNPECNLDISIPLKKKIKYRKATAYLLTLKKARKLAAEGKDSLATQYFFDALTRFDHDSMQTFGLLKPEVISLAQNHKESLELQYFTLKKVINTEDSGALLSLIKNLQVAYGGNERYDRLLEKAAYRLGLATKEKLGSKNAKKQAKVYFPDSKKLRKAFLGI